MTSIRAVLFDLDGTLLDTVPDLVFALNKLRAEHHLPALTASTVKSIATLGSKKMVRTALGIEEDHPNFKSLREKFLAFYQEHIADSTQFFPHVEKVLEHLEGQNIPWGIVTNKLTLHTKELLRLLKIDHRPACVICGISYIKTIFRVHF